MKSLTILLHLWLITARFANAATIKFSWSISKFEQNLDGVSRVAYGVNGKPGHETKIVVTSGDIIELEVMNHLNEPTSIHFHGRWDIISYQIKNHRDFEIDHLLMFIYNTQIGLLQNGTNEMDGVSGVTQCPIPAGGSFTYRVSTAGQVGTFWWHSHFRTQYPDGLRGPVIILDPKESQYASDTIFQLSDW